MQTDELVKIVRDTLDDHKAHNIKIIDVKGKTVITDVFIIATGTSDRHVKALADYVALKVKENGGEVLGVEGELGAEWVLVDLGDAVVHVMTAPTREFYQLEKLWEADYREGQDAGAVTQELFKKDSTERVIH
ncbi:MAG: ribosome silencing factor [Gammaproteobacteria bacterium]